MKITSIEIKRYSLPLDPPFPAAWDPVPRREFPAAVVAIRTDAGLTGYGSGDLMLGFEGHEELFIGRDPMELERHWAILDNLDFHYGRCWPIDLALWDLVGKATGRPVAQVLGADKNKILAYASTGELVSPEIRAERALALIEAGFKAMKIRFHHPDPKDDLQVVKAVRKAIGDKLKIMVDANQGWRMPWDTRAPWTIKEALGMARALAELDVFWLEEPLAHYDYAGMADLRKKAEIRIAGGEMNRRWPEFREMIGRDCLDVYQPDVALCGGITGVKRVAESARAAGAWFSPHTWTNGVGVLANLHLALAVSDCPYLEYPFDPPTWTPERRDFLMAEEDYLQVDAEGYLHLPAKPGLGFDLAEGLERHEV